MSADLLRRAATVLRERAEKATVGPWHSEGPALQTRSIYAEPGQLRGLGRDLAVAERVFGRDAAYIATVHPGVGLALAEWLEAYAGQSGFLRTEPNPQSLAVARAILGETA